MDIIEAIEKRYSTKEFNSSFLLSPEQIAKIKSLLRLAPSSTNIQPWHFILAESGEAKERVAKATQGFFHFNERKVLDSALVVIFSTRIAADEPYLEHITQCEQDDGRFSTEEFRAQSHAGRKTFDDIHRLDLHDEYHWLEKQTYLNAGSFLLGVAAMGLDAVPMEGFEAKLLSEEFALIERGYYPTLLIAVGYRAETDFNAELPKSRLPLDEIIEMY